jgi:hypothetical protein
MGYGGNDPYAGYKKPGDAVCVDTKWLMQGDGNVFTTIEDMSKFLRSLRDGDAVLKPKSKVRHCPSPLLTICRVLAYPCPCIHSPEPPAAVAFLFAGVHGELGHHRWRGDELGVRLLPRR